MNAHFTNDAIELVKWPLHSCTSLVHKVLALQTTRLSPQKIVDKPLNENTDNRILSTNTVVKESPYSAFNLGLHVGDDEEQVTENRSQLKKVNQPAITKRKTDIGDANN